MLVANSSQDRKALKTVIRRRRYSVPAQPETQRSSARLSRRCSAWTRQSRSGGRRPDGRARSSVVGCCLTQSASTIRFEWTTYSNFTAREKSKLVYPIWCSERRNGDQVIPGIETDTSSKKPRRGLRLQHGSSLILFLSLGSPLRLLGYTLP